MTLAASIIPIVDFSGYSIDREKADPSKFQQLIDDVTNAITTVGFAYLINTGLSQKKVNNAFSKSVVYFQNSNDQKRTVGKSVAGSLDSGSGFIPMEGEGLDPQAPHKDLKELFDFVPYDKISMCKTYDTIAPGFISSLSDMAEDLIPLLLRILEVIGRGLKLEDPLYFVKAHSLLGGHGNTSIFRTLYYPPTTNFVQKEGQIRCGEHTDYGGITLLIQDDIGGLEVKTLNGEFVPARPTKDAVVINIGDLLQRWTADKLKATAHRVVLPEGADPNKHRQSMALFSHPDSTQVITCIDGSNKYPPVEAGDYIRTKHYKSYAPIS